MNGRAIGWARGVGFVAGFAVAMTAVLSWRIPAGTGTLGADLSVVALRTGELTVSTSAPFLVAGGMRPGSAATGSVDVYNDSGSDLRVTVAAQSSSSDLGDLLWLEVDAAGEDLFRGPLSDLLEGTEKGFEIGPGNTTTLGVRGWLPTSVDQGFEGRSVDLALVMTPRAVTGS
jgi:hypothetical protein